MKTIAYAILVLIIRISRTALGLIPSAMIHRNETHREAIFMKTLADSIVGSPPLQTLSNVSLVQCGRACLRQTLCDSFNYKYVSATTCHLLQWDTTGSGPVVISVEGWNYYQAQRKHVLPCKRVALGKDPGPFASVFYGTLFDVNNLYTFCDPDTDGGGWTIITAFHRYYYPMLKTLKSEDFTKMTTLQTYASYLMTQNAFVRFSGLFEFKQIRFLCYDTNFTLFVDIATSPNASGESVVKFLRGEIPNNERPASCGSFVRLSRDNTAMSQSCGTWPEGKWNPLTMTGEKDAFYEAPFEAVGLGFKMLTPLAKCGGYESRDAIRFKIYVR